MSDQHKAFREEIRKELLGLSHRAVVAFAARCARRVQPLFRSDNPTHVNAIDHAIALAEAFASGEKMTITTVDVRVAAAKTAYDDANAATYAAYAVADADEAIAAKADANAYTTGVYDVIHPTDRADIARAAAARATTAAATSAADAANAAVTEASNKTTRIIVINAIRSDLKALRNAVAHCELGKDTPVPPSFFGLLWPNGKKPHGWPDAASIPDPDTDPDHEPQAPPTSAEPAAPISLYFDVAEFTDAEVTDIIESLSDQYRELGGDRLVITGTTMLEPSSVLEPVGG